MNYLRVKSVAKRLDIGESSVWKYVKDGILPKPIKISARTSVWRAVDIDNAIERLATKGEA